ncbi:polysaccharide deacetylase family protein [Microbulbifer sp. OS29]|uniref:Polysaccharide deacetylase family protein n=1 Tax=Microbulbifer okhotskensis TaxID=2926617 RepID=A0A9X2EKY3_9GAMM|nr:polysaccharide deacetylase family protein [Microbulbifer okhotskensis]MCO1334142.1 polysaccharide deacetylase family protein [Microbulbifer okhotskensis]
MGRSTFLLITCLVIAPVVNAKQLAITFDDAPRAANGYFDGSTRANTLIENLSKNKVGRVAFFSNTQSLDKQGLSRMRLYDEAGHLIGNHTHSHPNFLDTDLPTYQEDFLKAHQLLKQFNNFQPYFRFPYLREGETLEKRDGMRTLLQKNEYKNAYITLNNYDWYIEVLFQKALKEGKSVDLQRLSNMYIDVLMESIEYYDEMAIKYLGRSPKHVLLLHETDISALFIGDLAQRLRQDGWEIIPPKEAYQDPVAEYQLNQPIKYNPGRIGEIALGKGQKKELWHYTLNEDYLEKRFQQEVLLLSDN